MRFIFIALLCLGLASTGHAQAPAVQLANVYRGDIDLAAYWVSEKYDGVRGYWDGQRLLTRNGRVIAAPAWFTAGWPATPMDGELWAGRGRFVQAQGTVAREQPDDEAWRAMRYMVFDLPAHLGPFDERLPALQQVVDAINRPWVQAVEQRRTSDRKTLQRWLDHTVAQGGEGLMLRRGASRYQADRNDDLLKLKPHDDAEAVVVAHRPGQGKHAGRLGALLVQMPNGARFRLGTGFSDAERDAPPPVGSTVTYRHHGWHPSGLPRFASFLRVRIE
jgi:DNA ligase-1